MIFKATILIVSMGMTALFLTGCSSSSYNQRYNEKDGKKNTSINKEKKKGAEEDSIDFSELFDNENEFDEPPPVEKKKDLPKLLQKYYSAENSAGSSENTSQREKFIMEIIKYIDTPYKYGGNSDKGIDCSAFTQTIFANVSSYSLPRSAREQYEIGYSVDRDELKFGDLIFFNTRRRVKPGHVGIYIGENLFAHSSTKLGVTISSLDEDYYSRKFMGGRRIREVTFNSDTKK